MKEENWHGATQTVFNKQENAREDDEALEISLPQSRMLGAAAVTTRVAAAFAVAVIFLASVALCSNNNSEELCSRTCAAENCNSVGIRYGKYCGVGWTGCPGEKPCDDVDACCKIHDDCVGNTGINDVKCHEKFKKCIKKVQKSGKVGFSKQCPYETVVPTMVQGMDLAIMFSQFSNSKLEL